MDDLDKYHLRATEWKTSPVTQPKHDFVNPLVERYLTDLSTRQARDHGEYAKLADTLRVGIDLEYTQSIVNDLYKSANDLKNHAKLQEER
jgi:hypothetical protein